MKRMNEKKDSGSDGLGPVLFRSCRSFILCLSLFYLTNLLCLTSYPRSAGIHIRYLYIETNLKIKSAISELSKFCQSTARSFNTQSKVSPAFYGLFINTYLFLIFISWWMRSVMKKLLTRSIIVFCYRNFLGIMWWKPCGNGFRVICQFDECLFFLCN